MAICARLQGIEPLFFAIKQRLAKKGLSMRVGVPKEIKTYEYRVGLTPGAVREYVNAGHSVLAEKGAGVGIGADDEIYRRAGAVIVDTAAEVFATADLIVKVKEPELIEWSQLRE